MKTEAHRTLRLSPLSVLLGTIAATCFSGCGDDSRPNENLGSTGGSSPGGGPGTGGLANGGAETGGTENGGSGGQMVGATWLPVEGLECETLPSIKGLNPAIEIDSLSFYRAITEHLCVLPDYNLEEVEGTVCASSETPHLCEAEVERLRSGSADWSRYEDFWEASFGLLVATGSEENIDQLGGRVDMLDDTCGSFSRGSDRWGKLRTPDEGLGGAGGLPWLQPSVSAEATSIRDVETLRTLLGKIDTGNEALLMFWANNHQPSCAIYLDGEDYVTETTLQINDCPSTYQDYEVRISPDGEFSQTKVGESRELGGCAGRRPEGLTISKGTPTVSAVASWLQRTARLETAAVAAFAYLIRDLRRLGGPEALIQRAEKAALDEIRHAREVAHLALSHGATLSEVCVQPEERRSVLSLAVENAVEGCVRECWGALMAHYQAMSSSNPEIRRVWSTIAEDESQHAELSMDLAVWFSSRLTSDEKLVVKRARLEAIESLRKEVSEGCSEYLDQALGLPGSLAAAELFARLEQSVFDKQAA